MSIEALVLWVVLVIGCALALFLVWAMIGGPSISTIGIILLVMVVIAGWMALLVGTVSLFFLLVLSMPSQVAVTDSVALTSFGIVVVLTSLLYGLWEKWFKVGIIHLQWWYKHNIQHQ